MTENETISLPNPFAQASQSLNLIDSPDLEGLEREMGNEQEKPPNFPSFYPLVYHSISTEIPHNYSFVVKFAYSSAWFFTFYCIFQFIFTIFAAGVKHFRLSPARDIFLALAIVLILPVLLFYLQYYPFYCSLRDEQPQSKGLVAVQIYVIFILLIILIGIPGTGCIGIWWTIIMKKNRHWFLTILGVALCIWDALNIIAQICLLFMMKPLLQNKGRIANPADY